MGRVGRLIALGLVGVLSIVAGCGRPSADPKAESQPLDWVDREDEPFPGLSVPRPIARSLLRAARKRDPSVRTSEEVGRVLLNALLADRSPSTFPVVSDHVTAGLNLAFRDYGGRDKQLSIQSGPGDSHRELLIVSVADPNRIQGLEDQQVWLPEAKEGLAVVFKPETRPESPANPRCGVHEADSPEALS